jgi:Tfp pilus assembly protein PilX
MSSIHPSTKRLRSSERGMVSIITTMVLMIVISLIVLGFAQLSRRNQREALDRQLSTQAFYAAESGVNEASDVIKKAIANGTTIAEKTACDGTGPAGFYAALNPTIDAASNVRFSCLLVDPTPTSLRYGDIGTTSVIVPVISANGDGISRIELDWQAKVSGNPLTGCPTTTNDVFSPTASWACGYGVLRFDLVPTAGNTDAAGLQGATMTTFAVPFSSGGTSAIAYGANGANGNVKVGTTCTATSCSLAITGLSQNSYHMRISSLYRNVGLQLRAENAGGSALELQNAQAVVDVTGRAQDVLRRIQVHVPLRGNSRNLLSDYAIQSTDPICKRFSVMDGYFGTDVNGVSSPNRLCQP